MFRSGGFRAGSAPAALGRLFVAGRYYTPSLSAADSTNGLTQNLEYAVRFEVGVRQAFDRIGLEVTTGVGATTVRLGIRQTTMATGDPGSLVVDAGTIDSSGTGFLELTIAQTLEAGRYWLTCALQGGAGVAVRARPGGPDPLLGQAVGTTFNACSLSQSSVSGALPATWTTGAVASVGPKILLRAA